MSDDDYRGDLIVLTFELDPETEEAAETITSIEDLVADPQFYDSLINRDGVPLVLLQHGDELKAVAKKATGMGHHHFPKELLTGVNHYSGFSDDVIDFAWGYTTSPIPGHKVHPEYNAYIKGIFDGKAASGHFNPSTTTVEQMKGYIDNIAQGRHPFDGQLDSTIKNFVDTKVAPHVTELTPPGTTTEIKARGRRFMKDHFDDAVRTRVLTYDRMASEGASPKRLEATKTALERELAHAERVTSRMPTAKPSSYLKRAGSIVKHGAKRALPVIGAIVGVISWHENVEAYGEIEGTLRSAPVLGDIVVIVVDGAEIARSLKEISDTPENDPFRDSLARNHNMNAARRAHFNSAIERVANWKWVPQYDSNLDGRIPHLATVVNDLAAEIHDAVSANPGGFDTGYSTDLDRINNAVQQFEARLQEWPLHFQPPSEGGGPAS